jgi:L-asparagine oxygenase
MNDAGTVTLDESERQTVDTLVADFPADGHPESAVSTAGDRARRLPPRLLAALDAFRRGDWGATLRIRRPEAAPDTGIPTPAHWRDSPVFIRERDVFLLLVAAHLGEAFAWRSQQGGRLVTDVIPIRESAQEQTGHGSAAAFDLHCEDAFTDYRCNCVALTCVRNTGSVPTLISRADTLRLSSADIAVLTQPRFIIAIDTEHVRNADSASFGTENDPTVARQPVALLTYEAGDPHIRIDCADYVTAVTDDAEAVEALGRLNAELRMQASPVSLAAGDIILIDNARAAHGRPSYRPNYDGADRWLRRVMVAYPGTLSARRVRSTGQRTIKLF